VARIEYAGGKQWQMLRSGSSYLSQSELVLTFGLGQETKVSSVRIEWPSGKTDQLKDIAAGQTITVEESKGIVSAKPFSKHD